MNPQQPSGAGLHQLESAVGSHLLVSYQPLGQSQLRCYLCETPKQEYSLTRYFSEVICRGCLNYEGPDRIEYLIAEARRFKQQQPASKSHNRRLKSVAANRQQGAGAAEEPSELSSQHSALLEQLSAHSRASPIDVETMPMRKIGATDTEGLANIIGFGAGTNWAKAAPSKAHSRVDKRKRISDRSIAFAEDNADSRSPSRRRKSELANPQAGAKVCRFETVESPNPISRIDQQRIAAAIKSTRNQVVSPNKQATSRADSSKVAQAIGSTSSGGHMGGLMAPQPQHTLLNSPHHQPLFRGAPALSNLSPTEQYLTARQQASRDQVTYDHYVRSQLVSTQKCDPEGLLYSQHFANDPNVSAASSLALFASADCGNPAYFLHGPQAIATQSARARSANHRLNACVVGASKQAPPQSLPAGPIHSYPYPIAIAPYLAAPSGPAAMYCPAQYHPYQASIQGLGPQDVPLARANPPPDPTRNPASLGPGPGLDPGPGFGGPPLSATSHGQARARKGSASGLDSENRPSTADAELDESHPSELSLRRLLSTTEATSLASANSGVSRKPHETPLEASSPPLERSSAPMSQQGGQVSRRKNYERFEESRVSSIKARSLHDENNNSEDGTLIMFEKCGTNSCGSSGAKADCAAAAAHNDCLDDSHFRAAPARKASESKRSQGRDAGQVDVDECASGQRGDGPYPNHLSPSPGRMRKSSPLDVGRSGKSKSGSHRNFDAESSSTRLAARGKQAPRAASQTSDASNDSNSQGATIGRDHRHRPPEDSASGIRLRHRQSSATSENGLQCNGQQKRSQQRQAPSPPAQQPHGADDAGTRPDAYSEHSHRITPNASSATNGCHYSGSAKSQIYTPHLYPLKCMSCGEHLEDRHFVQCPSVVAHKFCFACSKRSIEAQQVENKTTKNPHERVFCPSGERCFLATEQTPWTFMNSEIETIFRESSRQSATGAGPLCSSQHSNATTASGVSASNGDYPSPPNGAARHQSAGHHRHKDSSQPEPEHGSVSTRAKRHSSPHKYANGITGKQSGTGESTAQTNKAA